MWLQLLTFAGKLDMVIHDTIIGDARSAPFGQITEYSFNDTITKDVASIKIQNSYTEQINTTLFVLPSQSFINTDSNRLRSFLVRAAVCFSHLYVFGQTKANRRRRYLLPPPTRAEV